MYNIEEIDAYLRIMAEQYEREAKRVKEKMLKLFANKEIPNQIDVEKLYSQYNDLYSKAMGLYTAIGGLNNGLKMVRDKNK